MELSSQVFLESISNPETRKCITNYSSKSVRCFFKTVHKEVIAPTTKPNLAYNLRLRVKKRFYPKITIKKKTEIIIRSRDFNRRKLKL